MTPDMCMSVCLCVYLSIYLSDFNVNYNHGNQGKTIFMSYIPACRCHTHRLRLIFQLILDLLDMRASYLEVHMNTLENRMIKSRTSEF